VKPYLKYNQNKKGWGNSLSGRAPAYKYKTLSSNSSTDNKKKKKGRRREIQEDGGLEILCTSLLLHGIETKYKVHHYLILK
jgi:hypothetical protein